ncbi:MAG: 5'/3'-nucleotidase SurE [Rikenellaceae bacterium]
MKDSQRLILVTNDDGVGARGIEALVEVARRFGRVVVVAPKTPQSGMSQAITSATPLFFETISRQEGVEIYSLSGTPVDCVKYATDHLLISERVDLVLSGINHGTNAGPNLLYSGTMGAAIEGHFYAPSIGLSLDNHSHGADFTAAKFYTEKIIEQVLSLDIKDPLCLNVNIPDLPLDQIKGIKSCRQNRGYWREEFYERTDPRGREYYWLTGSFINTEPEAADSDIAAMEGGYVAVVPVKVDMTDYDMKNRLSKIFE